MKKKYIFAVLALSIVVVGCNTATIENTDDTDAISDEQLQDLPVSSSVGGDEVVSGDMTLEQMAMFDGKDGNRCYVAINGDIFDLSDSNLWANGAHTTSGGRASCGQDLTDVLNNQAPTSHRNNDYPSQFPKVGELV